MHLLLPPEKLLPPVCPTCGAPGVHSRAVVRAFPESGGQPCTAHYCDLCEQRLNRQTTSSYGWLVATVLFELSLVTALALFWGNWRIPTQLFITVSAAVFVTSLWFLWGAPQKRHFGVVEEGEHREGKRLWFKDDSALARTAHLDASPAVVAPHRAGLIAAFRQRVFARQHLLLALPLSCGLLWLGGLHTYGGVRLRVLHGGSSELVLLVDGRRVATVESTQFEDPSAGRFVHVLGGRRNLVLLRASGEEIARSLVALWPGRTYLVGQLPPGRCLYLETRTYGRNEEHRMSPIEGQGPLWELPRDIDGWFQPLPPRARDNSDFGARSLEQVSSGGTRTALRLLSCKVMR